jgi:hypothetical protein
MVIVKTQMGLSNKAQYTIHITQGPKPYTAYPPLIEQHKISKTITTNRNKTCLDYKAQAKPTFSTYL